MSLLGTTSISMRPITKACQHNAITTGSNQL